jgi:endonuclease/exonuclease/phosphatase (EEP) superfamily protein YafD
MRRFFIIPVLKILHSIAAVLLSLAYIAPTINPVEVWQFEFLALAFPWLLLINITFLIFWLIYKDKFAFLAVAVLFFGVFHIQKVLGFHYFDEKNTIATSSKSKTIRVATFNSLNFTAFYLPEKGVFYEPGIHDLNRFVEADVFCIQEPPTWSHQLLSVMCSTGGFLYHCQIPSTDNVVFSKFPILKNEKLNIGTTENTAISADIAINGQIIRFFSLHLQSNQISGTAENLATSKNWQKNNASNKIIRILREVKSNTQKRAQQAKYIAHYIEQSPHPVVVCGDFNDTPQSYVYETVSKGLKDTFVEKGRGMGITYAGVIPSLRIDYILTDPSFKIIDNAILKKPYSDHYAVTATIDIGN